LLTRGKNSEAGSLISVTARERAATNIVNNGTIFFAPNFQNWANVMNPMIQSTETRAAETRAVETFVYLKHYCYIHCVVVPIKIVRTGTVMSQ